MNDPLGSVNVSVGVADKQRAALEIFNPLKRRHAFLDALPDRDEKRGANEQTHGDDKPVSWSNLAQRVHANEETVTR